MLDVATNQNKQHPLDKRDGGKNHDEQDEFSYRKLDKARNAESHDDTYFLRNAEGEYHSLIAAGVDKLSDAGSPQSVGVHTVLGAPLCHQSTFDIFAEPFTNGGNALSAIT